MSNALPLGEGAASSESAPPQSYEGLLIYEGTAIEVSQEGTTPPPDAAEKAAEKIVYTLFPASLSDIAKMESVFLVASLIRQHAPKEGERKASREGELSPMPLAETVEAYVNELRARYHEPTDGRWIEHNSHLWAMREAANEIGRRISPAIAAAIARSEAAEFQRDELAKEVERLRGVVGRQG